MYSLRSYARLAASGLRLYRDPRRLDEILAIGTVLAQQAAATDPLGVFGGGPQAAAAFEDRYLIRWDLAALADCPPGSLGRAVHDHCRAWGIDPDAFPPRPVGTPAEYALAHIENTHDVWHPVTGFGSDEAGEIGLQLFYLAQLPNPLALFLMSLLNLRLFVDRSVDHVAFYDAVARGWELGKRAAPLFGYRWSEHWDRPLADVRRELGVAA